MKSGPSVGKVPGDGVAFFFSASDPAMARTIAAGSGRGAQRLTRRAITPREAHAMVRRRAKRAGVTATIGNHTFCGTGITAYLKNGGTLEKAREMANRADTRTTRLYDRRAEDVSLDEVERISI